MGNKTTQHHWSYLSAITLTGVMASGTASAGVMVSGGVAGGGASGSAGGQFTFDSGADQTLLSRDLANTMGLLVDDDGDGTPDLSDGMKNFNGGEVETWCFDDVAVAAIDSAGNNCSTSTTVYVSKNNDSWASANLLGKPWQNAVDACYRARTNEVKWPWEQPPDETPKKTATDKTDGASGEVRSVFEGIILGSETAFAPLDMTFFSGSQFSFVPAGFADAVNAPLVGQVDLAVDGPELLARLSIAHQNMTQQTVFNVVQIELVDMQMTGGPPITLPPQPLQVLVADDFNSQFGIMGDNMLQFTDGVSEWLFTARDAFGQEALYFTPLPSLQIPADLNGDGFVGIADLNVVLGNWNQNVTPGELLSGDPSNDGYVGIEDLNVVLGNWNAGTPPTDSASIPEPTTLLLFSAALFVISRRPIVATPLRIGEGIPL